MNHSLTSDSSSLGDIEDPKKELFVNLYRSVDQKNLLKDVKDESWPDPLFLRVPTFAENSNWELIKKQETLAPHFYLSSNETPRTAERPRVECPYSEDVRNAFKAKIQHVEVIFNQRSPSSQRGTSPSQVKK